MPDRKISWISETLFVLLHYKLIQIMGALTCFKGSTLVITSNAYLVNRITNGGKESKIKFIAFSFKFAKSKEPIEYVMIVRPEVGNLGNLIIDKFQYENMDVRSKGAVKKFYHYFSEFYIQPEDLIKIKNRINEILAERFESTIIFPN